MTTLLAAVRAFAPFRRIHYGILLLAVFLTLRAAAAPFWQISLVGDMDDAGRKLPHPTPDKPAYYFPIVGGYQELGAKVAGEKPASTKQMVHDIAVALASEGYLASREIEVPAKSGGSAGATTGNTTKALSPPPTLLLVLHWGYLNAEKLDLSDDVMSSSQSTAVLNRNQILGLTAGKHLDSIADFGLETQALMEGVTEDRYFIMISAYDFAAYNQQHKKVRLWVAKMSTLSKGANQTDAMPALMKAGAAILGRETIGPKLLDVSTVPEGHVEVGTPTTVKDGAPSQK